MANKWIQKATQKMKAKGTTGAFSEQAKNAGMTTKEFANKVLSNKSDYSSTTEKRAQFVKNIAGLKVGGSIDNKLLPKAQPGAQRSGNATPVFNSRKRRQ